MNHKSMNHKSPLASLDLSDDRQLPNDPLVAKLNDTRRDLIEANDQIEQLGIALRGLLCVLRQIGSRPDSSAQLREVLITHPHIIDAQEILL